MQLSSQVGIFIFLLAYSSAVLCSSWAVALGSLSLPGSPQGQSGGKLQALGSSTTGMGVLGVTV